MVTYLFSALLVLISTPAWASSPGGDTQHHEQAPDWPAANRAVEEAGGWKAYLRESAAAQAASQTSAFRPDRSAAQRAKQVEMFSVALDGWVQSALGSQPGLLPAVDLIAQELASIGHVAQLSSTSRTTLSQALGIARQVTDDAIVWLYAQEYQQRRHEKEDLAEVSWALARRMASVGNIPLVEEREARLHWLEAKADLHKAEVRAMAARESLARHLRPMGDWSEPVHGADGVVLPLLLSASPASPAGTGAATASEDRAVVNRFTRLLSAAQRDAVSQRARAAAAATPYALRLAYAVLVQAEDQLQLATARARLLVDEGLSVRQTISEEHLLAYNGMLIGTPKLLKDRDAAMAFELEVLESLRDYWLARSRRDHQQVVVLLEELFWGVRP